jgi:hypothetical protein
MFLVTAKDFGPDQVHRFLNSFHKVLGVIYKAHGFNPWLLVTQQWLKMVLYTLHILTTDFFTVV